MEKNYTKEQILNALLDMQPCMNKESRRSISNESFEIAKYCMEICMITDEKDLKSKRKYYSELESVHRNRSNQ